MFLKIVYATFVAFLTASAMLSPCPDQQTSLAASASQYPKPTGDLSSYISSYSRANNGVFQNCKLTNGMNAAVSSEYQDWVTEVGDWSTSLSSTIAAAQSTCLALVVNIVVATPLCSDGSDTASVSASSSASSTPSQDSSGAKLLTASDATLSLIILASVSAIGALAVLL